MNKCILFSLGLAGAGAWNKEKMNLKQMVKSNKQTRRRVQAERAEDTGREEREHWLPFHSCFSKPCKANRERKYKGLCSHFLSESPTRTTETCLISPVQLYLCAQSFQNSNITPRDAVCLSAACLMESQKLTPFHCS